MQPTMKLRWVKRQNNRPVATGVVSCGDGMVFVLQQWWEGPYCAEWRDIPIEVEE